jgi:acyl-CoA synthetase (AMP-forming)/AMP-acid ligase II
VSGSLARLLDGAGDDVVVHAGGVGSTRSELRELAGRLATELRAADLAGRAIGVLLPNTGATIAAWFGSWEADMPFVPLNPRVPRTELARSTASTGVAAVVTRSRQPSKVVQTASAAVPS